jgi:RNA polymerase sigma-70 factor (ECF subfamily)
MPEAVILAHRRKPLRDEGYESDRGAGSFAALVERHARFVFRIALAVTRNPQDAEDAVQETFLQIYRGNRWEQMVEERSYLARVAWRLALRQTARQTLWQGKTRSREQEFPDEMPSPDATPEEQAADRQLETWLHARIDALPEKLRQPLALAALGDVKLVEIAAILGLPEGTVRRRIHTARKKLREEIEKRSNRKGGGYER